MDITDLGRGEAPFGRAQVELLIVEFLLVATTLATRLGLHCLNLHLLLLKATDNARDWSRSRVYPTSCGYGSDMAREACEGFGTIWDTGCSI